MVKTTQNNDKMTRSNNLVLSKSDAKTKRLRLQVSRDKKKSIFAKISERNKKITKQQSKTKQEFLEGLHKKNNEIKIATDGKKIWDTHIKTNLNGKLEIKIKNTQLHATEKDRHTKRALKSKSIANAHISEML